jgi:26S proteasome regulatory subunit N11
MLLNLHKSGWTEGLKLKDFEEAGECNVQAVEVSCHSPSVVYQLTLQQMLKLATAYTKSVQEESTLSADQLKTRHVGKLDPKRHLEEAVEKAMGQQVVQNLPMGILAEL